MEKAIFLDRDGTIIEDVGYPHERERIRFLPRVDEAIRLAKRGGFKVIVVSNQAGVARGYFTEETVKEINSYIQQTLMEQGAVIDMMYYCPHHVEGTVPEYARQCSCRKPQPGMLEQAIRDFDIDSQHSFVIGDQKSDIEAGRRVGCRTILLSPADQQKKDTGTGAISDYIAPDLYHAVKLVLDMVSGNKDVQ